ASTTRFRSHAPRRGSDGGSARRSRPGRPDRWAPLEHTSAHIYVQAHAQKAGPNHAPAELAKDRTDQRQARGDRHPDTRQLAGSLAPHRVWVRLRRRPRLSNETAHRTGATRTPHSGYPPTRPGRLRDTRAPPQGWEQL